jgi:HEAT repeat protein
MVAASLGRCPASETVPCLVELLREEREPYKRGQLIQTLGLFGPKARAAIPLIRESLQDRDEGVRETSREALEKIVPERPNTR